MEQPIEKPVEANFQMEPEKSMEQVTLQKFEEMCHQAYKEQDSVEELERDLDERKKLLANTKARLLSIFQQYNKPNWRSSRGLIMRQKRFAVQTPKDPAAKKAFFDWLKKKGVFEETVTIHSQTLNSLYKQEMEAAIKAGASPLDFKLPGIGEPKYVETLVLRRNR